MQSTSVTADRRHVATLTRTPFISVLVASSALSSRFLASKNSKIMSFSVFSGTICRWEHAGCVGNQWVFGAFSHFSHFPSCFYTCNVPYHRSKRTCFLFDYIHEKKYIYACFVGFWWLLPPILSMILEIFTRASNVWLFYFRLFSTILCNFRYRCVIVCFLAVIVDQFTLVSGRIYGYRNSVVHLSSVFH